MNWSRKIVHLLLLAILPVVLSVAYAAGQVTAIYPGQKFDLSIEPQPAGSTYQWSVYCDMTVDFAKTPPNCPGGEYQFTGDNDSDADVEISFNTPGEYMIKIEVWDAVSCTNNMKFIRIDVLEDLPTAVLEVHPDSICIGEWADLEVTFTGTEPWSFKLQIEDINGVRDTVYTDIMAVDNPLTIPVGPRTTTTYTVIEVTDKYGKQIEPSNSVTLTVSPIPRSSRIYLKE